MKSISLRELVADSIHVCFLKLHEKGQSLFAALNVTDSNRSRLESSFRQLFAVYPVCTDRHCRWLSCSFRLQCTMHALVGSDAWCVSLSIFGALGNLYAALILIHKYGEVLATMYLKHACWGFL